MAIEGTWNLTMQTPMGNREVKLVINEGGQTLAGEFQAPQGNSAVSGSADGAAVNFSTNFTGAMGPMELKFDGTHDGDSITGTVQFGAFGSGPFTATRA